ncbi:DUF4785 domain-containing protein [Legionella bononiensis]|uniref:DUF4785 family protein n=1 Tax=Legionella bononiensis TaxID=2793102 RepID=A0ABS1W8J6_9GAMM|nr:DUF4785 domain-containing protein [Legionella bononiensis]MBL7479794.1 DUF4785 family protein [Legionella bononiensis]MBL7525692.1 DUF4785 family protein [Legionella bononiensis]MBL7561875.1 DUF4785 family protein [Legionella bononiensis]
MKTTQLVLISAFCFTQAHALTLPRQPVKSYECDVCSQLSHENLQDKWSISNEPLNRKINNSQKSYGYKERISLEQLRAGVLITTTAPGAVVRITPMQNKLIPQLKIKTPKNQLLSLQEASALFSQDEPFGDKTLSTKHQTMLQIKPELGFGTFILKSDEHSSNDADAYLINVYDKFSPTYLEVQTDSIHYQYGDKLTAKITLVDDYIDHDIYDINATLIGPGGQYVPLKLSKVKKNQFEATIVLNSENNDHGENWYLETNIQSEYGQELIRRSGHTAFSYSVPSASMLNVKKLSSKPLTFVATLDVATGSRYALQSVLYRKNGKGEVTPIETSQRAQWLEPGKQVIQFTFDNSNQLSDDSLYLGYLRLIDYGQLKTVYQYNQPIKLTQLVE